MTEGTTHSLIFTVEGPPRGKARSIPNYKQRRMVHNPKNKPYEELVQVRYKEAARRNKDYKPNKKGAFYIEVRGYMSIPKSWPKARKRLAAAGHVRPIVKPDDDNIAKIIRDALNGLAWRDDAQVVDGHTKKFYTTKEPYTVVKLLQYTHPLDKWT